MRSLFFLAAVALLVASLATQSALAQSRQPRGAVAVGLGGPDDPFWGRRGDYICRRWCLSDRNPCDPVRYKLADGRCSGDERSFFGVLKCRIGGDPQPQCPH